MKDPVSHISHVHQEDSALTLVPSPKRSNLKTELSENLFMAHKNQVRCENKVKLKKYPMLHASKINVGKKGYSTATWHARTRRASRAR